MRKLIITLIAATLLLSSCGSKNTEIEQTDKVLTSDQYTCPMHPEVVSDKAGSCSKCGMDLVKKETGTPPKIEGDTSMKM